MATAWASLWGSNARAHAGFMYTGAVWRLRFARCERMTMRTTRSTRTSGTATSGASTAVVNSEVAKIQGVPIEQLFSRGAATMVTFARRGVPCLSGCAPGNLARVGVERRL